jgi:hypothetical protein
MNAPASIALDTNKLNAALGLFPRDRAMIIGGRETKGSGEMIERTRAKRRQRLYRGNDVPRPCRPSDQLVLPRGT